LSFVHSLILTDSFSSYKKPHPNADIIADADEMHTESIAAVKAIESVMLHLFTLVALLTFIMLCPPLQS
jgi:hypothetical protein